MLSGTFKATRPHPSGGITVALPRVVSTPMIPGNSFPAPGADCGAFSALGSGADGCANS